SPRSTVPGAPVPLLGPRTRRSPRPAGSKPTLQRRTRAVLRGRPFRGRPPQGASPVQPISETCVVTRAPRERRGRKAPTASPPSGHPSRRRRGLDPDSPERRPPVGEPEPEWDLLLRGPAPQCPGNGVRAGGPVQRREHRREVQPGLGLGLPCLTPARLAQAQP